MGKDRVEIEGQVAAWLDGIGLDPIPLRWVDDAREGCRLAQETRWPRWAECVLPVPVPDAIVSALTFDWPRIVQRHSGWGGSTMTFMAGSQPLHFGALSGLPGIANILGSDMAPGLLGAGILPPEQPASALEPTHEPFVPVSGRALGAPGLYGAWIRRREIIACPPPEILRHQDNRLHRADGPAVAWPSGCELYFWRGVHVPPAVVMAPDTLTVDSALTEANTEVRRVMLERIGFERVLAEAKAQVINWDAVGILYHLHMPNEMDPLALVKVQNSTPEPDGSYKDYVLRVPPDVRTARAAIAWTFGMQPKEYAPRVQT